MAQPRHLQRDEKRTWHVAVDPNDPRLTPKADTGFSLNEDDPEKKPSSRKDVPVDLLEKPKE